MECSVRTLLRCLDRGPRVTSALLEMRGQVEAPRGQEGVRAVDRALQILLAFTPGDDELTVAELSARVALSRPTLYRLLERSEQPIESRPAEGHTRAQFGDRQLVVSRRERQ